MQDVHTPQTIYLKDYEPTPFLIKTVDLEFQIYQTHTEVHSKISIAPRDPNQTKKNLVLNGVGLDLKELKLNGSPYTHYKIETETLVIADLQAPCLLETLVHIYPETNTSLEGLYASNQKLYTQCEAEGFRKITYFYDRPDVMATYTVTIEADKNTYPILLSNGNEQSKESKPNGRHSVRWHDPFPKPSYLFALVAGNFGCLQDSYTTKSARRVALAIYAKEVDIPKCHHAMESLKKSMQWDEERFGLECDLDHYKIVAASDFNMGAMENKGLNVFNTALVLAHPQTTTDGSFQAVEAVVGHEYFHNWTGNRVTCRDWFQLCLKEGLTVFRDQEFSADMGSRDQCRISDVRVLRQAQFAEDASPMSHPPRPDKFIEINNFYTATVYEKGAECVRMIETLIGKDKFRKGMDLYFARHDGEAVTQEDFVRAMADASGKDLTQFFRWYTDPGTPHITAETHYDQSAKAFTLTLSQTIPDPSRPRHIPVLMGLVDKARGTSMPQFDQLIELTQTRQTFLFKDVPTEPIPSLFRKFSAPVKLTIDLTDEDLTTLMAHDTDAFNSWDASDRLFTKHFLRLVKDFKDGTPLKLPDSFLSACRTILLDHTRDEALKAMALQIPNDGTLIQHMSQISVEALKAVRSFMTKTIATHLQAELLETYEKNKAQGPYKLTPKAIGQRSLKNLCLSLLGSSRTPEALDLCLSQFYGATNMTDEQSALAVLANWDTPERQTALADFYKKWESEDLVIDAWFSLQALSRLDTTFEHVQSLLKHKSFTLKNPNRLRSLLMSFCRNNIVNFHRIDGAGYALCREKILEVDKLNPQMASHLARSLIVWRQYDETRAQLMKAELQKIVETPGLSGDVYEVVKKAL